MWPVSLISVFLLLLRLHLPNGGMQISLPMCSIIITKVFTIHSILIMSYTSFTVNITNNFTFKKGWTAEISGFYRHKALNGLTQMEADLSDESGCPKTNNERKRHTPVKYS